MSKLQKNTLVAETATRLPKLPIVDWAKIGAEAPEIVPFNYEGANAKLPLADIVIITWTSAEWSALDHVFVHSQEERNSWDTEWRDDWKQYSRNAPKSEAPDLWGFFTLVKIKNKAGKENTVLLYKSESHLAHPPYIQGLSDMVKDIITDVQPKQVYTIGTAGGASLNEVIGDVVVTNAGHIELEKEENKGVDYNNKTFSCDWFPPMNLMKSIENNLLFPLSDVLTIDEFSKLINELHDNVEGSSQYTLADMMNYPIDPENIKNPQVLPCKDKPLLTTDFYFIANGDDSKQYSALEMDDTVIGHEAGLLDVDYCFIRNISDPIVANITSSGETIPDNVREEWSSLIYKTCGFYTSFNGALTTWAAIAG